MRLNITPIGDKLLVRKCAVDHVKDAAGKVIIYRPDASGTITTFNEIVAIGPKCKERWTVGAIIKCPERSTDMHRVNDYIDEASGEHIEEFIIRETAVKPMAQFVDSQS